MNRAITTAGIRATLLCSALALAGCLQDMPGLGADAPASRAASSATGLVAADAESSAVIAGLLTRESVLSPGSPFAEVSSAVLAANSRPQEAQLRAARLRAVAASRNWLPTLGPQVSLTSMGDLVANMLIEQVLFDNGGKKAERAFAAADVEVAATALAEDTNDRVATALGFYIAAERARATAAATAEALGRAEHFEHVMQRRVQGGVSDRTELAVIRAKRSELESDLETLRRDERQALAELNAMSARPLSDLRGLGSLTAPRSPMPDDALTVVRAGAEGTRSVAEARVARAGLLPGLTAGATVGAGRSEGIGLNSGVNGLGLGPGTPAQIAALEASTDAASRETTRAREDAARQLAALAARRDALGAEAADAQRLADEAESIYTQYARQYQAGFRTILDVVGTFENALRFQRQAIALRHEQSEVAIGIARRTGTLVDGSRI